ncbi:MAG: biopolymer transporter ExbD [bacterium]
MVDEKNNNYEYLPENYEEEVLKRKREARKSKDDKEGKAGEIEMHSLMDILTILLVFLLKSYATDPINIEPSSDLDIPKSTAQLRPVATVSVTVSKSTIVVDNQPVMSIKDGKVDASEKRGGGDGYFIEPLHKVLTDAGEKKRKLASINPNVKFDGICTLVMDREIPYRLLTEIMYTAGQAEFQKFKFAVIAGEEAG